MWKRLLLALARTVMDELKPEDVSLKIIGPYQVIALTKDKVAYVSPEDFQRVAQYKWHASLHSKPGRREKWYARARVEGKMVYMHRFIQNFPDGLVVDHKDNNGLNNTRSNLQDVTQAKNTDHCRFGPRPIVEPFL